VVERCENWPHSSIAIKLMNDLEDIRRHTVSGEIPSKRKNTTYDVNRLSSNSLNR
jgi:hypothetical protein